MELDEPKSLQLDNLINEDRKPKEIIEFFKSTYQIDIPAWVVYQRKHKLSIENGGVSEDVEKTSAKKSVRKHKSEPKSDNVIKEVIDLLKDIQGCYDKVFKFQRGELIKSRAQVYEMMKGAGIPIEGDC